MKKASASQEVAVVCLTQKEVNSLIRIVGCYQGFLEDLIDSALAPGELTPRDPGLAPAIAQDRRRWREAENLVILLSGSQKQCLRKSPPASSAPKSKTPPCSAPHLPAKR
jgi:hypothetical protein